MLHGVTMLQVEAIPTTGLPKSASPNPTARSMERLKDRSGPSTTIEEWGRFGSLGGLICELPAHQSAAARASGVFVVAWPVRQAIHSSTILRMAFNLKKVLKALLQSSSHPLSTKDIQAAFERFHMQSVPGAAPDAPAAAPQGAEAADAPAEPPDSPDLYEDVPSLVTAAQIREAMDEIAAELAADDGGLTLVDGASGYRLATHPRFARWIRILREEPPPVKLSQSSVETLAVVAYRQPVTRAEIESVRGVSADAGISKLLERELITVVGRAELPGRPIQYGTTDRFLELVGIKSIDELPASDVLSSRQIDDWLKGGPAGHTPNDADMGLDETELALGAPSEAPAQANAAH
jgi:segregation and condensation protein B